MLHLLSSAQLQQQQQQPVRATAPPAIHTVRATVIVDVVIISVVRRPPAEKTKPLYTPSLRKLTLMIISGTKIAKTIDLCEVHALVFHHLGT